MNSNSVMFLEEFRTICTMRGSEPSEVGVEMRIITSESEQFALDRQMVDGHTELRYHLVNRSAQMKAAGKGATGKEFEMDLGSFPQSERKPHEARVVELPVDFGNRINERCRMLLIGLEKLPRTVGLTPPLWFAGLPDLEHWLTVEGIYVVSVRERVNYTREDDDMPSGTSIDPADVILELELRILSATRQSPEAGGGYEIMWRVDAMKAELVYLDPKGGINRLDDSGSSHGSATFDESGVLISLAGTGTSESAKDMNSNHNGPDGQPRPGTITQVEDVEISVRRS